MVLAFWFTQNWKRDQQSFFVSVPVVIMHRSTIRIALVLVAAAALAALGVGIAALVNSRGSSSSSSTASASVGASSKIYAHSDTGSNLPPIQSEKNMVPVLATLEPGTVDVCDRVVIRRGANRGLPVVMATNDLDAMTGVGYALADERFFQLDFYRKLGGARLSELMGPSTVSLDVQLWTIDPFPDHFQIYNNLPATYRDELDAIAKGINVWLLSASTAMPGEYSKLGFANKSQIDPFSGVDLVHVGIALAFTTIDTSDLTNTQKLQTLLASQVSGLPPFQTSGPCVNLAGFPFSLSYTAACKNLVRFLFNDLVGFGGRRANFATPTAEEYLTWFNVTPAVSDWSNGQPSAKRHAQQDQFQAPPVDDADVAATLPENMEDITAAVDATVANATSFVELLKERLESMSAGMLLSPEHGSNAMAFNGPRILSNIIGATRSVHTAAPDNAPVFPSFFHQIRVIITPKDAQPQCITGGEGFRNQAADAYVTFAIAVPLYVNTKDIAMGMTTRYADNVDLFVELIATGPGYSPLAALSGRPAEAPRPTQVSVRQFYARIGGTSVPVTVQSSIRIPANNYATVISYSPITSSNSTLASAVTIQTMLSKSWRTVSLERMMRFRNVMEAEAALRDSLLPSNFHLIMSDKLGNIAHMPVGLRVPLREDYEIHKQPDLMGPQLLRDGYSAKPHRWLLNASAAPNTPPFQYLPDNEVPHIVNPASHQLFQANQDPTGIAYADPVDGTGLYRYTTGGMVYLQPVGRGGRMSARAYQIKQELPASGAMSLDTIKSAQSTRSPYYMALARYIVGAYDWAQANPSSVTATTFLPGSVISASAINLLRNWGGKCLSAAVGNYDWGDDVSLPPPLTRSAAVMDESAACTVAAISFDALLRQHAVYLCAAVGQTPTRPTFCPMSESAMTWLFTYNTTGGILDSGLDMLATSTPLAATRDERRVLWLLKSLDSALAALRNAAMFPAYAGSTNVHTYQWGKIHRYHAAHVARNSAGQNNQWDVKLPRQPAADGLAGYPYPSGFSAPFQSIDNINSASVVPLEITYSGDFLGQRHNTPHLRQVAVLGAGASPLWQFESTFQLGAYAQMSYAGPSATPQLVPATNHSDDQFYAWIANKYFNKDDDLYIRP